MIPVFCIMAFMIAGEATGFGGFPVRVAAPASLACICAYLYVMNKKGNASPVLKTMAVFLALETLGVWMLPQDSRIVFGKLAVVQLYALLLAMALIPLVTGGTPFTTFFARKGAPQEVWETDIFKQINRNMSGGWAGLFFVCGLFAMAPMVFPALGVMPWTLVFRLVLPAILLLGPGRMFNKKYPDYYIQRLGLVPQETEPGE